jgi:hypothetical protein
MPVLTFELIRENPWNVISHPLPAPCRPLLHGLAYLAADYCCKSEYLLMNAALDGNYVPTGWRSDATGFDKHQINGERGWKAEAKRNEFRALYETTYGKLTVRPLYTDDVSEFVVRHLSDEDCGAFQDK